MSFSRQSIARAPPREVLPAVRTPAGRRAATKHPAFSGRQGAALEPAVREVMQARLGHDFSTVRVHTDRDASEAARSARAAAFTRGRDIFFGEDRYSPTTLAGQRLLAHELAHVAQQEGGGTQPASAHYAEREAADASVRVAQGERASPQSRRPVEVAYAPEDDEVHQTSPTKAEAGKGGDAAVKRHPIAKTDRPPTQRTYVRPPGAEDLPEGTHSITKSPPGSRKPKPETEAGVWAHENYEKLERLLRDNAERLTNEPVRGKEFKIPDRDLPKSQWQRIDRLDWEAGEVIEIKPEHLEAEGWAEAEVYADYMNRRLKLPGGRMWKPRCVTYNQAKVMRFLRKKGYLEAPKPRQKAKAKPRPRPKAKAKPKPTAETKSVEPTVEPTPATPTVEPTPATPTVEPTPATPTVEPTPATPTVEPTPATPTVEPTPATPTVESTPAGVSAPGGGGLVGKVAGGAGYLALGGEIVKDLHEGRVGAAAQSGAEAWALSRLGVPGMIGAGAYSTIMAYRTDPTIQEHANAAGDWVAGSAHPTGLRRVAGATVAAGEATGEAVYKGVFKPVGTAIGEGLAAAYLEVSKPPAWVEAIKREQNRRAWQRKQRERFLAEQHKLEEERANKDRQELEDVEKLAHRDPSVATSGRVVTRASVGAGGRNSPADVRHISGRLRSLGFLEADTGDMDELADAIRTYQTVVMGERHPSGRVAPGDPTLRALSAGRKQRPMALP